MVLAGLWHGLVFLPVALGLIGPERRGKRRDQEQLEMGKKGEEGEEMEAKAGKADKINHENEHREGKVDDVKTVVVVSERESTFKRRSSSASLTSTASKKNGDKNGDNSPTLKRVMAEVQTLEGLVEGDAKSEAVEVLEALDVALLESSVSSGFFLNRFYAENFDHEVEYFV